MAYVSGKGRLRFGGLGLDLSTLSSVNICEALPDSPACAQYQAAVKAKIDSLYKDAGSQIVQIAKSDPILAKSLAGAKNPTDVYNRAKQLASAFTKDVLDQDAYRLYYSYGHAGWEALNSYVEVDPRLKASVKFAHQGLTAIPEIKKWADRVALKGIDSAAVVDGIDLGTRAMQAARNIAAAFGSGDMASVIGSVTNYMAIASGCVAMISAGMAAGGYGAALGAVGCGVTFLTQVFSDIFGRSKAPTPEQSAVISPQDPQKDVISADAQRLAALLRYRYNIPNYAMMVSAINERIPSAYPRRLVSNFPGAKSSSPVPAFSIYELVLASWWSCGGSGHPGPMFFYPEVVSEDDLATKVFRYEYAPPVFKIVDRGIRAAANPGEHHVRRAATIRILEWISFFAAISAHDKQSSRNFISGGGGVLATRLWGTDFSEPMWSFPQAKDWFGGQLGEGLYRAMDQDQQSAWYVVGYLRLLAAFSYLNLQYHNGYIGTLNSDVVVFNYHKDMIADLDPPNVARAALRLPVNPRFPQSGGSYQVLSVGSLVSMIRSAHSRLISIEESAKAQAKKDSSIVELTGESMRQMIMSQAGATSATDQGTSAAMRAMIESRGGLQAIVEERKKCAASGGMWFDGGAQCDVNPTTKMLENCRQPPVGYTKTRYNCVPAGTPGAQAIPPSGVLPTDKSGGGTILTAAGVGLLGLLLMRVLRP
jgi:hypothetical protein